MLIGLAGSPEPIKSRHCLWFVQSDYIVLYSRFQQVVTITVIGLALLPHQAKRGLGRPYSRIADRQSRFSPFSLWYFCCSGLSLC